MNSFQIFALQFTLSLIVSALLAKWYVAPRLATLPLHQALIPLLFIHCIRHQGLNFLVPAVVDPSVPRDVAAQIGYGDLVAVLLALASIIALRSRWPFALALVWLFSIEGTVDLLNAFYQGLRIGLNNYQLGAAWYIPTFAVPALLVSHFMIFAMLVRRSSEAAGGMPSEVKAHTSGSA